MTLPTLISRLESASGPDRELDVAILQATDANGYKIEDDGTILVSGDMGDGPGWFNIGYEVPKFTESLDAAITLTQDLPDDFGIGLFRSSYQLNIPDTGPRWRAEVWNIRHRTAADYRQNLEQMKITSGKHATPAIAICIVLLRARAQGE